MSDELLFDICHTAFRTKVTTTSENADMHKRYIVTVEIAGYKNLKGEGDSEWHNVAEVELKTNTEAQTAAQFVDAVILKISTIKQLGYLKTGDWKEK